jgi:hypothetical protein
MQVKSAKEEGVMPKFHNGQRVRIPASSGVAYAEWRGKAGEIMLWLKESPKTMSQPITVELPPMQWHPAYIVQFDGDDKPKIVPEDWLMKS